MSDDTSILTPAVSLGARKECDECPPHAITGNRTTPPPIGPAMVPKRPPGLDGIDVKILSALQRDGRSTIRKLAETVGLTPRPCLERVRRLEAAGIIVGYQAVIQLERLARPVFVFAEIALEKQARRDRFERRLARIEEIVECWEVSGDFDYLARFVCPDLSSYEALSTAGLASGDRTVRRRHLHSF
jgi:DNA-binding Lrp family transcriptional regulator